MRLKIENSKNSENTIELKKKRNNIQKVIKREQKQTNQEQTENPNEIINLQRNYQFFKVMKYVSNSQTKQNNIGHDNKGKIVANPEKKHSL